MLLQGEFPPFTDTSADTAQELVKNGTRPSVYHDIWYSDDSIIQALKDVMIMCHQQDPNERASARAVEAFLTRKVREFDPHLETLGLP
jgi:hypothetical protein